MIDVKKFTSLFDLLDAFPTEQSCIEYLENIRWKNGVVSPFDEDSRVYVYSKNRYICKNTRKIFNIRTGTIFENTKLSLRKWFMGIWLVLSNKKGISSLQLSRDLRITQKTAWFLLQRIRFCLDGQNESTLMSEVEADETFVGGKNKNRHASKKVKNSQGRSFKDKTPVLGMVQRKGNVVAKVIMNTSKKELTPRIFEYIDKSAIVYTDEWLGYNDIGKSYSHYFIDHSKGQYADGDISTNTIEGFWTLLKRGYIGIYHSMSRKHLQKYVDEFVFRYNTRQITDKQKFDTVLFRTQAYRMTYQDLIAA